MPVTALKADFPAEVSGNSALARNTELTLQRGMINRYGSYFLTHGR